MSHGPRHGWLHGKGQLPSDIIYDADIAFGKQQDVYIVSGVNGSDVTGDGSPDKPFEHTSAAITAGKAAAKSVIAISIDHTVAYELLSIPGTVDSVDYVYITATEPFYTYTDNFDFVLEQGSHLMLNNVWANLVKEAVAITGADLTMEEGAIDNFVDSTGTGNPVNTDAHIFGAYIGSGVIVRLNGAKSFEGWTVNQAAEKGIVCINPMNMNSKKIINVADGTVASDAVNYGQLSTLTGALIYKGTWNASTNTPTLANTDTGVTGYVFYCDTAGSVDFGAGSISFNIGDRVVNNGTIWQKWDVTDEVVSIFSRIGAVTAQSGDYTAAQVTNAFDKTADKFTAGLADTLANLNTKVSDATLIDAADARIMKADVTLAGVAPVYADLTGAGWVNGDRGMGVGTGSRIFLMSRYSDALKYVELS